MNKAIASVLLAAVLAVLPAQPDAMAQELTIYKWVDEEGVVNYGASPPEGIDYVEIGIETKEPVDPANGSGETEDEEDVETAGTPPEQPQMTRPAPDPEVMAERCAQARRNMENLNRYENLTVRGEDGEQRPVSDEERIQLLEEAQQFIEEWC